MQLRGKVMIARNEALYKKALELYDSGLGSYTIGKELGVKPDTVIRWLRKSGVHIRGAEKYDREKMKPYIERYFNGESAEVLGAELGLKAYAFRQRVYKLTDKKKEPTKSSHNSIIKDPEIVVLKDYDFYVPTDKPDTKMTYKGKQYTDISFNVMGY